MYDMLPVTVPTRACQDQTGSSPDSGSSFTVGGYSHASFHGLRRYTKKYPWTGALLASIVRSIHPAHRFTTISFINNVQSLMHTDSHNDEDTCNLILPFSTFSEGGLWIENPRGSVRLDTSDQLALYMRRACRCSLSRGASTPPFPGQDDDAVL